MSNRKLKAEEALKIIISDTIPGKLTRKEFAVLMYLILGGDYYFAPDSNVIGRSYSPSNEEIYGILDKLNIHIEGDNNPDKKKWRDWRNLYFDCLAEYIHTSIAETFHNEVAELEQRLLTHPLLDKIS